MPAENEPRPTAGPAPFGFQRFADDTPRRALSDPRRQDSLRVDPAWTGRAHGEAVWTPAPPRRDAVALDLAERGAPYDLGARPPAGPAAPRSLLRHLAWPLAASAAAFAIGLASGPYLHRLAPAPPAAPTAPVAPPGAPPAAILPPLAAPAPAAPPHAAELRPARRTHRPAVRARAAPARAAASCAGSPAQRIVCRDATLAALDGRLRRAYGHALAVTAAPRTLRRDQDDWLNAREDTARISRGALIRLYQARIAELQASARRRRRY